MRPRALAIAWVVVAVVFLLLLFVELSKYSSLMSQIKTVTAERQRLTSEIQLREQQLLLELRKNAPLLQEMQWTIGGADPTVFLNRIAELAREKRMTITTIGPLERRSSPQFTKSWHAMQVRAPYREMRDLAGRIEQDGGILEDVRIQAALAPTGQQPAASPGADEVQASFNLVALEMSPQGKTILAQALAAGGGTPKALPGAPPALPVPSGAKATPPSRDPFAFLTPPTPPRPAAGSPGAAPAAAPLPELALKGIVSFPDGFLAIVNNQIVKVGDTVSGYRVERITEGSVTFTMPGATPGAAPTSRTIELPELAPAPAAAPTPTTAPRR